MNYIYKRNGTKINFKGNGLYITERKAYEITKVFFSKLLNYKAK